MCYANLSNCRYVVTDLLTEPDFFDDEETAIENANYLSANTGRTYFVCDIIETVEGEHPYTSANDSSFLVGNSDLSNPFEDEDGSLNAYLIDDEEEAGERASETIRANPMFASLTVYQVTPLFNIVRTCDTVREY